MANMCPMDGCKSKDGMCAHEAMMLLVVVIVVLFLAGKTAKVF